MGDWVVRGSDVAELANTPVRSYQRMENGRPETVRNYQQSRLPGQAQPEGNPKGWIPEPDWLQGQKTWVTRGEAAWKKAEAAADAREAAQDSIAQHDYKLPDTSRLHNPRGVHKHPADHPFFKANPVSPEHIIASYDRSTPEERRQGMRWYQDAQNIATQLAGGDTARGAAMLAAYSPQTGWPTNLFNAARALATGRAPGPGDGMITEAMQRAAQRVLNGEDRDSVLVSPKTNAFARLIEHGADAPDDPYGQVVIDRHAMSVAMGKRLSRALSEKAPIGRDRFYQHVADQYRDAALQISQRDGTQVTPHQLQAITWLRQQAENEEANKTSAGGKGRNNLMRNEWQRWEQYAREHGLETELGTTANSPVPITAAEARGDSRAVSNEEFFQLAAQGRDQLHAMEAQRSAPTGLIDNLAAIKQTAFDKVQQPWGGITINSHTGQEVPDGADKYALSVKPPGYATISIPEASDEAALGKAIDEAVRLYAPLLEQADYYLGVFHDDAHHRIDIDPVVVTATAGEAEAIGAYTRNLGGAYHFKTGQGHFPPHVGEAG